MTAVLDPELLRSTYAQTGSVVATCKALRRTSRTISRALSQLGLYRQITRQQRLEEASANRHRNAAAFQDLYEELGSYAAVAQRVGHTRKYVRRVLAAPRTQHLHWRCEQCGAVVKTATVCPKGHAAPYL